MRWEDHVPQFKTTQSITHHHKLNEQDHRLITSAIESYIPPPLSQNSLTSVVLTVDFKTKRKLTLDYCVPMPSFRISFAGLFLEAVFHLTLQSL
jgi:hypothetical protein